MAKGWSQLYVTLSGSIGGITFLNSPDGQIISRARTNPVNPNTPNQTLVRSAFSGAASAWDAITETERVAWDNYAAGTYTDKTGRQTFMSNYTLALYVNSRSVAIVDPGTQAPVAPGGLAITDITATAPPGPAQTGIGINITNPNIDDIACAIEISRPFNASRRRFKGPFVSDDTQFVTLGGLANTQTLFLALTEDLRYFFRIRALTEAEPIIISNEYWTNALAVAAI